MGNMKAFTAAAAARRSKKSGPFTAGFSLIEIIIALTILAVGLITVLAFIPVALDAARKAADLNRAALAAYSVIEEIKSRSFLNIAAADNFDTAGAFRTYNLIFAAADEEFPGITFNIQVSPAGRVPLKDITVTAQWTWRGRTQTETFQTSIAKYDPIQN